MEYGIYKDNDALLILSLEIVGNYITFLASVKGYLMLSCKELTDAVF